jgi:gluconate 2-dehydrogenase gamma chain
MAGPRNPSRRMLFRAAGVGTFTYALPAASLARAPAAAAGAPAAAPTGKNLEPYAFLNAPEVAFLEAAVARLVPKDDLGPGALEAGAVRYIDRQLAGAWGAGARLYTAGPWRDGEKTQGYQLPFTPAQLFRHAMRSIEGDLAARGGFAKLPAAEQDAYLRRLEKGEVKLEPVPAKTFFDHLLQATMEGFLADPSYGGNQGMVGWRLVGFPGAYANYYDTVDRWNVPFEGEPIGMGDPHAGHGSHGGHGR